MERKRPQTRGVAMNQLTIHTVVVKEKHRVEEAQFHHGGNQPKVLKQENQKEVIN